MASCYHYHLRQCVSQEAMDSQARPVEKAMLIDDEEDDDLVLVEDKTTMVKTPATKSMTSTHPATKIQSRDGIPSLPSPHSRSRAMKDISTYVNKVKACAKRSDTEVELMRRSLKSMESSLEEAVFEKLKFLVNNPECLINLPVDKKGIQTMIQEVINDTFSDELVDLTGMEMQSIERRLDSIETANHTVSKMFLECHSKLKAFGMSLAEESKRVNDEIAHYEKILSQKTINIDDDDEDDDDDVKIVDEPTPAPVQPASVPEESSPSNLLEGLSINQLRSRFVNAVQTQMPGLLNTLNTQQARAVPKISSSKPTTSATPSSTSSTSTSSSSSTVTAKPKEDVNSTSALANLLAGSQPDKVVVWPPLQANDRVMGKKFNDVWYPGHILDVYPPNPPQDPQWRCKVRFNKGLKVLPGRHVAYKETLKCVVKVGTRVIALYKEEDAPNTMYAGIIAEAPSIKNNKRFLVFFDDGYAQYCHANEVHKVYMQSENVWEDIHPETRSFIKDYLDIYPERPMVRLAKGQVVKTEWNGKWWTAKVIELDASLVKMVFQADRRTEWIYRGSTRLEPLFRALTNANAIKAAGSSRGRRLNLTMKPSDVHRKPAVEYTRGSSIDDDKGSKTKDKEKEDPGKGSGRRARQITAVAAAEIKKKSNVARKSTGGSTNQATKTADPEKWEAPWIKYQRKAVAGSGSASSGQRPDGRSASQDSDGGQEKGGQSSMAPQSTHAEAALESLKKSQDIASVLQERLAQSSDQVEYDEHMETGKRRDITIDTKGKNRTNFTPHRCSSVCLGSMEEVLDDPIKMKGTSPLLIPLMCFWERQVCKARPNPRRYVIYRGPCGRRLRSLLEVDRYLHLTDSNLGIDLFSFDHNLHVSREFVPIKTFCDIKDLSYGIENYPISCVNGVDRHYPDYVEYYNYRIPAKGVNLNLNPDFLACCDCTDNCRDRSKCACQQLTTQNTSCVGSIDDEAGYHNRRLREPLFTGIFECNANCPCDKRCHNKVAQLGLRMRLQVFRTEKKGWGLRCLDDISKGSFICIYAGQLLTDRGANEDGKQYGDEYLAELDFMEVVEGQKEGYESDVEFSDDDKDRNYQAEAGKESDDSDYSSEAANSSGAANLASVGERRSLRRKTKDKERNESKDKGKEKPKSSKPTSRSGSTENPQTPISISDEDDDEGEKVVDKSKDTPMETDQDKTDKSEVRRRAKKSTGGSRLNLSYSAVNKSSEPEESQKTKNKKAERLPTRSYFHDDTECYIMDAKSMGNLGRYLNHSCSPNVFVQNVFVDTHDLRFPWVAFFAGEYIRAGTELTWDYNYEVGSVPDKILYCYCGSSMCRGRLL